jgi:hypothetical protein
MAAASDRVEHVESHRKKAPKPSPHQRTPRRQGAHPGTTRLNAPVLAIRSQGPYNLRSGQTPQVGPGLTFRPRQRHALVFKRGALVTDPQIMSTDINAAESADATARTVLRLLAVGDIDIVWSLLHEDFRRATVEDFLATSSGPELLAAYGPRLHRPQFLALTRQRLLDILGPLPSAEADRRVRTVDIFGADDCVVVTFQVDGEPEFRWAIELTLTEFGWRLRNLARHE